MYTCCECENQFPLSQMEIDERMCQDCFDCEHDSATYQPWEQDNNVPESYTCDDCGKELELPEPDYMLQSKEYNL